MVTKLDLSFITREWLDRFDDPPACSGCGVMAGPHLPNCQFIEEKTMHYKNGREAKNGDKVMVFPSYGAPYIGILYDAQAGNDYCNGKVSPIMPNDPCPNLQECLHLDDVKALVPVTFTAPDGKPLLTHDGKPAPVMDLASVIDISAKS